MIALARPGSLPWLVLHDVRVKARGREGLWGRIIAMLLLSWQLTIVSVLVLPLFIWATGGVGKWRRRVTARTQESLAVRHICDSAHWTRGAGGWLGVEAHRSQRGLLLEGLHR